MQILPEEIPFGGKDFSMSKIIEQLGQGLVGEMQTRRSRLDQQRQMGGLLKSLFPDIDEETRANIAQSPMNILQQLFKNMQLQQYQKPGNKQQQQQQPSSSRSMMGFQPQESSTPESSAQAAQPPQAIQPQVPEFGITGTYPRTPGLIERPMTENQKKQLAYKEKTLAFQKERKKAKKTLTDEQIDKYLKRTGGDVKKAKELAKLAGYEV